MVVGLTIRLGLLLLNVSIMSKSDLTLLSKIFQFSLSFCEAIFDLGLSNFASKHFGVQKCIDSIIRRSLKDFDVFSDATRFTFFVVVGFLELCHELGGDVRRGCGARKGS